MHAHRHVRQRIREGERALQDASRPDPVRDVDDLHIGSEPLHDAVAGADEVVLEAEVGEEGDEHQRELTASSRPSRSCEAATAATSSPAARASASVCGPIATTGRRAPVAASARAADAEATIATSPSG